MTTQAAQVKYETVYNVPYERPKHYRAILGKPMVSIVGMLPCGLFVVHDWSNGSNEIHNGYGFVRKATLEEVIACEG